MLSPDGKCKSLDANADGYCRSEAVVTMILQRRRDAKRIYSSIYHSDTNCDGYKEEGITFPSSDAQYALMKRVFEDCKLDPERDITYIEAHMTGTPVGDPVESLAIDPNVTMTELGMDSLMAVEIKQRLEREHDIVMTTQEIRGLTYKVLQELESELEEKKVHKGSSDDDIHKENLARIEEIFSSKDGLFVELRSSQTKTSSLPIFLIPTIEGDFATMKKIVKYISRPVVGIYWISEFDNSDQLKDVAVKIARSLVEKYGACEYDLVGYSFGALLGLQIAIHLQRNTSATVRRFLMLDGSPDFVKIKCNKVVEMKDTNHDKIMETLLVNFIENLIDNPDEVKENLSNLPNLNSQINSAAQMIESKYSFKLEPDQLLKEVKRMYAKFKMVSEAQIDGKLKGDIELIRAEEYIISTDLLSESYNIEKYCTGISKYEKLSGNYKTFIELNSKEIGTTIDTSTHYLSI